MSDEISSFEPVTLQPGEHLTVVIPDPEHQWTDAMIEGLVGAESHGGTSHILSARRLNDGSIECDCCGDPAPEGADDA